MKPISTGTGLCVLGLGIAVLGAAQLVGSKGGQAFAQSTGDRHIVSASVYSCGPNQIAYRIWSDNQIELRNLGFLYNPYGQSFEGAGFSYFVTPNQGNFLGWRIVDNGLTTFVPADVDANGTVDPADLGGVLIEMGNTQEGNPPPPIDCTINAPR